MQLLKLTRLPLFVITTLLMLSVVATPHASAQSCPAADADDGSSDGVITIDDGGTTTWTDTDGTAFDCATLSITVTNSSTLAIAQDQSTGYAGQINAVNLTIDAGSIVQANNQGCAASTSPSLSTNICADGGTSEGGDYTGRGGGGGANAGNGAQGQLSGAGGTYQLEDPFAPAIFGAGGGNNINVGVTGGVGGGALHINLTGNLTNNGTISVNGQAGVGTGGGGGGGGSLYIQTTGDLAGSGQFEAKGGDGRNSIYDGGGGGGGFIYIEYATTSIATIKTNFASQFDSSGGIRGQSGNLSTPGSVIAKNTTSSTIYYVESESKLPTDSSVCSSNTCTFGNLEVWNGATMHVESLASTGVATYLTIATTTIDVNSGGEINTDGEGCGSSTTANASTNVCADGGNGEGTDSANTSGAGGAGFVGSGGRGQNGAAGGGIVLVDPFAPVLFGSGGGSTTAGKLGGAGGGVLRITSSGNFVNSGTIASSGAVGGSGPGNGGAGGGSGGSVYVTISGQYSGTGTFEAKGGNGNNTVSDGGGGGGGQVLVEYSTTSIGSLSTNLPTYVDTTGGTLGHSGSLSTPGGAIYKDTTNDFYYMTEGTSRLPLVSSKCSSNTCTFNDMQIFNGGAFHVLSDSENSNGSFSTLEMVDLTIDSGGQIDSDATGCISSQSANPSTNVCADGGTGEGGDSVNSGGGAAHGGVGGDGSTVGVGSTSTYGNASDPILFGSGGGSGGGSTGGSGGGVLYINLTGTLTQNGTISADSGANATGGSGGGSGGSVFIQADVLAGSSTAIYARGGAGHDGVYNGGGGGGGRVQVCYDTTNSSTWYASLVASTSSAGGTAAGPAVAGSDGSLNQVFGSCVNAAPVASSVTATQLTDGSGGVTIGFTIDDADDDDTLEALVEYSLDGGGSWSKATLSTTDEDTTVTLGSDPDVNNANTYQIGDATKVESSSGANTVASEWDAATDVASSTDIANAQIRITPYDGTAAGSTSSSSNFDLDVQVPVTPTLSYIESTDSESTTISASAAEVGTSIYKNGVDTGDVVAGDGTFTLSVELVSETNSFSITTVDDKGNVSVAVIAAIEKTSASGGYTSSSTTTSETTTEETVTEEETVVEEVIEEEVVEETVEEETVTEEETVAEETVPEETDDFAIAGDSETEEITTSPDTSDEESLSGEAETPQDNGPPSETPGNGGSSNAGGGAGSIAGEVAVKAPPVTPTLDAEEVALIEYKASEKRRQIQRVKLFFENEKLWGESNDFGIPVAFVEILKTDLGPEYDADFDGFTDYEELLLGSDPYVAEGDVIRLSQPFLEISDAELQAITDEYLQETGYSEAELRVVDTDEDGLSDRHEILLGTDPQDSDSDNDGLSDGLELLFFGTDPINENTLPEGIGITNVFGQSVSYAGEQLISGYAEPDSFIQIYDLTDSSDRIIGRGRADEEGKFVIVTSHLEPGQYTFVATSRTDKSGASKISNVVGLNILESLDGITKPEHDPLILEFGDKVEISDIRLGLIPELEEYLERELILMVTWESTIFGQTVIADAFNFEGTILFFPPGELELGKHDANWYALDVREGLRSPVGNLSFTAVPTAFAVTDAKKGLNLIPVIIGGSALLILLAYYRKKRKAKGKKKASNTTKPKKGKSKK